jgi:hypothetical protein
LYKPTDSSYKQFTGLHGHFTLLSKYILFNTVSSAALQILWEDTALEPRNCYSIKLSVRCPNQIGHQKFVEFIVVFFSVFGGSGFYHPLGIPNKYDYQSSVHHPVLVTVRFFVIQKILNNNSFK